MFLFVSLFELLLISRSSSISPSSTLSKRDAKVENNTIVVSFTVTKDLKTNHFKITLPSITKKRHEKNAPCFSLYEFSNFLFVIKKINLTENNELIADTCNYVFQDFPPMN